MINGKEKIRTMFSDMKGQMEMLGSTKDHMLIQGDIVVCDGLVNMKENGNTSQQPYCNIYEFEKGKSKKKKWYIVNNKKKSRSGNAGTSMTLRHQTLSYESCKIQSN